MLSHCWQEQLELGHMDMHGLGQASLGLGTHTGSSTDGASQPSLQGLSNALQQEGYTLGPSTLVQETIIEKNKTTKTLACLLAKFFML